MKKEFDEKNPDMIFDKKSNPTLREFHYLMQWYSEIGLRLQK